MCGGFRWCLPLLVAAAGMRRADGQITGIFIVHDRSPWGGPGMPAAACESGEDGPAMSRRAGACCGGRYFPRPLRQPMGLFQPYALA